MPRKANAMPRHRSQPGEKSGDDWWAKQGSLAPETKKTDGAEPRKDSTTSAYSLTDPPARPGYPLFSRPKTLNSPSQGAVSYPIRLHNRGTCIKRTSPSRAHDATRGVRMCHIFARSRANSRDQATLESFAIREKEFAAGDIQTLRDIDRQPRRVRHGASRGRLLKLNKGPMMNLSRSTLWISTFAVMRGMVAESRPISSTLKIGRRCSINTNSCNRR